LLTPFNHLLQDNEDEDSDVADDWDAEPEEPKEAPKAPPKPKAVAKAKMAAKMKEMEEAAVARAKNMTEDERHAEKARQQRLVEQVRGRGGGERFVCVGVWFVGFCVRCMRVRTPTQFYSHLPQKIT
jgi:hypothetical protein